jgi:hypothetical protein
LIDAIEVPDDFRPLIEWNNRRMFLVAGDQFVGANPNDQVVSQGTGAFDHVEVTIVE